MRIIIVGAGSVGKHLAKLLAKEDKKITLMDEDSLRLRDLETYDLLTYEGSPTSVTDLQEIGVYGVDLFVAVTPYESVNMTACMIANNLGAKHTLARIDNYEYLLPKNKEFFYKLGVDYLIYPEVLAAQEILDSLKKNWMRQYISFHKEALIMLSAKVRENAPIVNKKFVSGYFAHYQYRIVAIKRNSETIIPSGSDEVMANDIVYFVTTKDNLDFVRQQSGKENIDIRNIMIFGGTRTGQKIVQSLPSGYNIKIIEQDTETCYALTEKLRDVLIVNSDGRDIDVLKEEGIAEMDAFIAVSPSSEANILACMAAKRFGVNKTIAEVENLDYITLAEAIDIGTIINKKTIAASYIHQITFDADVLEVRTLPSIEVEVIELVAKEGSRITRKPVKNIRLPSDVNIGGIIRNGKGSIVSGDTLIQPNDHVLVFCDVRSFKRLEALFN